eukprot:383081_1
MSILQDAQLENTENDIDANELENLDRLPNESIYHICSYLNKSDINSFKALSIRMALIIFDIMTFYTINTFNMNELIEINEYKYQPAINIIDKIKTNRFPSFTKYKSLMDLYSPKYKIPFENMLIFRINNKNISSLPHDHFNLTGKILDTNDINSKIQNKNTLMFFDKTKLFSSTTITKLNTYNIFLIQYFDRDAQLIYNVQFICLSNPTKYEIINYIQTKLKYCPNIQKIFAKMKQFSWQQQLINIYDVTTNKTLEKIKNTINIEYVPYTSDTQYKTSTQNINGSDDANDSDIIFESLFSGLNNSNVDITDINKTIMINSVSDDNCIFRIILFELNDKHCFFQTQSLKQYDHDNNSIKPFYSNIAQFMLDQKLAQIIRVENKDYCITDVNIMVTPLTTYKMVKNKIRNQILVMFEEEISSSNIEIFRNTKRIASETELVLPLSYDKITWSIVPYITHGELHKIFIYDNQIIDWKQNECKDSVQSFDSCFLSPQTESMTMEMRYQSNKQRQYALDVKRNKFDSNSFTWQRQKRRSPQSDDYFNTYKQRMENESKNAYAPVIIINKFLEVMIDIMLHSGENRYEYVINKYNNREKYSFIMMSKTDIKSNKMFTCYENDDEFMIRKSTKSECLFDTYILIVENYKNIMEVEEKINDDELFPIIVRLSKKTFATFVGYPMKIWIGKKTKVKEVVNKFSISERVQFAACLYNEQNLDLDDVIYNYGRSNELLIKFEQKVSFQW